MNTISKMKQRVSDLKRNISIKIAADYQSSKEDPNTTGDGNDSKEFGISRRV